jgi:zinc transporter, ZIP family
VLAFGAGALVSAVSFELAQEGVAVGGGTAVAIGLGIGALTYFALSSVVDRLGPGQADGTSGAGSALALGAFLDGIPEQLVLGIGIAAGAGVSVGLLVAIFVSNLPEAIGSATDMREAGTSPRTIRARCGSSSRPCVRSPRRWAISSPKAPAGTSRGASTGSRRARSSSCWSIR